MKSIDANVMLTIGEAAGHFGLATHVLRHWESMGLLSPQRLGDRRRYRYGDLLRIAMVVRAKQAGLRLDEIAELAHVADATARTDILRRRREALLRHIERSRSALALLEHTLACEHPDFLECPRFQANVRALLESPPHEP